MVGIDILRSFRIAGFAVFDFVVSYLGVYLLAPYLSKIVKRFGITMSRAQWLYLTLPLAIIIHLLTGQKTPLMTQLFNPSGGIALKIIILGMIYKGIKG